MISLRLLWAVTVFGLYWTNCGQISDRRASGLGHNLALATWCLWVPVANALAFFALSVNRTMPYQTSPLLIPILAGGYLLAIYFLLRWVQRSRT